MYRPKFVDEGFNLKGIATVIMTPSSLSYSIGRRKIAEESLVANDDLILYRLASNSLLDFLEGRFDIYGATFGRL